MIAALNPWMIVGAGIALAISHGFVGIQAYNFGADRQRVVCEVRVNKIMEDIDKQNKAIEELKQLWDRSITAVQDAYNKDIAEEAAIADQAQKELADYEKSIADKPPGACVDPDGTISDDDIKRVRRKAR